MINIQKMEDFFINPRRPCPRIDNMDVLNWKTGNQNIAVSSEFQLKILKLFEKWFLKFFSFEVPTREDREPIKIIKKGHFFRELN